MIDSHTQVIGIIGYPLGHTLSPRMHNSTLEKMQVDSVYVPFEVSPGRLAEAVAGLRALNIRGVNVTIPHKQLVIPCLDDLSPAARACGAVNLIQNQDGRLIGFNTDGPGFMASLAEAGVKTSGRVLMLGAGGAAYSLAYELTMAGAEEIVILDIDRQRAAELAAFVANVPGGRAVGLEMAEPVFVQHSAGADLIINCTPVGMFPHPDESPINSVVQIPADAVIYDLIYNPSTTRFLAMAQARGLKTINGLAMLVHQGALTLEILLGIRPSTDFMKEVVRNYLSGQ